MQFWNPVLRITVSKACYQDFSFGILISGFRFGYFLFPFRNLVQDFCSQDYRFGILLSEFPIQNLLFPGIQFQNPVLKISVLRFSFRIPDSGFIFPVFRISVSKSHYQNFHFGILLSGFPFWDPILNIYVSISFSGDLRFGFSFQNLVLRITVSEFRSQVFIFPGFLFRKPILRISVLKTCSQKLNFRILFSGFPFRNIILRFSLRIPVFGISVSKSYSLDLHFGILLSRFLFRNPALRIRHMISSYSKNFRFRIIL